MLFAQLQGASPDQLGGWIVPFAGIVMIVGGIAWAVNQTRQAFSGKPTETKDAIQAISDKFDEHEESDRERFDDIRSQLNNMKLEMAKQPMAIHLTITQAMAPLNAKVDKLFVVMGRVGLDALREIES